MSNANGSATADFFRTIRNPLKLRLFLLRKLPAAAFAGLRIVAVSEAACTVSVPYRWSTTNPFRSTYFACLSMAAELSTGVLAMAQTRGHKQPVSMLITAMDAQFYKKATAVTYFTCSEGFILQEAVVSAVATGAAQTVRVQSEGRNAAGEAIAIFAFEWSFKSRTT